MSQKYVSGKGWRVTGQAKVNSCQLHQILKSCSLKKRLDYATQMYAPKLTKMRKITSAFKLNVFIKIFNKITKRHQHCRGRGESEHISSTHLRFSSWGSVNSTGKRQTSKRKKEQRYINTCIMHTHGSTQ